MASLEQQLIRLKEAREDLATAKKSKQDVIEKAQQSLDYQVANEAAIAADTLIAQLEANIRQQALDLHRANASLPEYITVKMFTVVEIPDELKAKEWCIAHFTPALKLDSKVFEKAAKDGNIPDELAAVTKEPRAQIATKL